MDFSGVNAHLVDVQNELNLLAAEDVARDTALTQTQNALNVANVENAALKARIAELEAQQPPPEPEPVPQRHVLWGASTAPAPTHHGTNNKEAEARYLEGKIGRKFDITRHYIRGGDFTGDGVAESLRSGRTVMLTFTSGGKTWPEVANKQLDSYLNTQLDKMVNLAPRPIYVAFENEPEADGGKGTPADYRRAAEYVLGIVQDAGFYSTTALMEWTWRDKTRDPEQWIPRINLDVLGVHRYFYNLGTCATSPRVSFYEGLRAVHATAQAHGVRLGVWEGGQQEKLDNPDFKANWNRAIPSDMARLPLLDAFTWWHSGGKEGPFPGTCDWNKGIRIDSTAKALAGYTEAGKAAILSA